MRPAGRGRQEYPRPAGSAALPAGVSLARLTLLTRLTPQQALVIAAEVLGRVAERHAEGSAVDGLDEHRVWVGLDGRVGLVEAPSHPAARRDPGAMDADVASCRRLLGNLGRTLRDGVLPNRGGGARERAAARLLMSLPDLDGGIAASAATVRAASAPGAGQATTELATLVSALVGEPHRSEGDRGLSAVSAPPASEARTATRDGGRAEQGWRAMAELVRVAVVRWGRWCLAALVLLGLLGLELLVFGDRIESDLVTLRAAGHTTERPAPAGGTAPALVSEPAPAANGPITAVDLRPLAGCEPGRECTARLQVRVRPGTAPDQVRWAFQLTDRCTGASWSVPGGSMRVGAGGEQLAVVATVMLPPGRALGVTAVVSAPARAASKAMLVPAKATC